ncbi:MAG: DUF4173 domain-containing protein [Lachnospiraceae bacterium]|nr:DUF4173 domain-containing protein [Lachnospiraceae bacterium]
MERTEQRPPVPPVPLVPAETEETKRLKENFGFIGPLAFGYAVLYAFCMYRNGSGVTFPFFVAGSLLFFFLSFARLGISVKKGSGFYMAAMVLLGISTFCTDDGFLIFFNKLGIFLLLMSLLLRQCFQTAQWKLGKYLGSICVLIFASIGELGRPFTDGAAWRQGRGKKVDKRVWYAALGLVIALPLFLIVLLLLASADAVFRQMTARLLQSISLGGIINIFFRITVLFFAAYAVTAYLCKKRIREDVADVRRGEPVLAITVTGMLTLLYLLFSGIQIAGLFFGSLRLPEGYTYAMYAREGFFQLLAVSLLNLIIVLCCMEFFRESTVLKIILTLMSLCTFVMIASSAVRMIMYIRCYYLTYLRILVLWALVVLTLLFAGVVVNIFKEKFPLFRYQAAVVAVLYLILSFAHPDYLIAKVNVANAPGEDGMAYHSFFLAKEPYNDYYYLRSLSADAAPVLVPYLKELGYDMEAFYTEDAVQYAADTSAWGAWDLDAGNARYVQMGFGYYWMRKMQRNTENMGIRTYNVSRHLALTHFRDCRE